MQVAATISLVVAVGVAIAAVVTLRDLRPHDETDAGDGEPGAAGENVGGDASPAERTLAPEA